MNPDARELNDLDRVIHEPGRLMIVSMLSAAKEADFTFLLRETGLTRGNLSTHLSKLEAAGYLEVTKTFRGKIPQTLLRLTPSGRQAFEAYRSQLKKVL